MKIKDLYIELSSNPTTYEKYCSIGQANNGKMFAFLGTNYRSILSVERGGNFGGFAKGFKVLSNVCGIKRSDWVRHFGTNQEIEKQHTVNMRKSEFFFVSDDMYNKTSRGIVFEKMINDENLTFAEKNILCYLLICNGYFADTPNYLFQRTNEIFDMFEKAGYSKEEIYSLIESFIKLSLKDNVKKEDLFRHEYFIVDSFYKDLDGINFLKAYKLASDADKKELHQYICRNYENKKYANQKNGCILSYKFKPSGVYTFTTVECNAWLLYVSKKLQESQVKNFDTFINALLDAYGALYNISKDKIKTFIYDTNKNRSVFQVIYCRIYHIPLPIVEVEKDLTIEEVKKYGNVDKTDEEGAAVNEQISQSLKKLAKINAEYKCEMEDCEMCKYFTAKENHKPYLEIHHFIPREFANDFDVSIEDINNYVALCPNCHRKIHLAEDGERKHLINKLFNERKQRLAGAGLKIELKSIYSYYKIDD